jgi:hypothetical protein
VQYIREQGALPEKRIPLSIRIEPRLKDLAEAVARLEHRSVTNLLEALIIDRARHHGIAVDDGEPDASG